MEDVDVWPLISLHKTQVWRQGKAKTMPQKSDSFTAHVKSEDVYEDLARDLSKDLTHEIMKSKHHYP